MMPSPQDSRPAPATSRQEGWFRRGLGWWLARKRRMAVALLILLAAFAAWHRLPMPTSLADPQWMRLLASLFLIVTFLGMMLVAGGGGRERRGDAVLRTMSGAMTGGGVALIFGAGVGVAAVSAVFGALLGLLAPHGLRRL